jgi:hypothetical protein
MALSQAGLRAIASACLGLTIVGVWLAQPDAPAAPPPLDATVRQAFNGTLDGAPGTPDVWTTNVTIPTGTHEVLASASWHQAGPVIRVELVWPDGKATPGIVPGNYQFSTARAHVDGVNHVMVRLTSEARESFRLEVVLMPDTPDHNGSS